MSLSIEESYIKKWNDKWTNFIFQKQSIMWDYTQIISNPNLQFDNELFDIFIKLENVNSHYFQTNFINFEKLRSYDNIPLSFISKHPEIDWNYHNLSFHPNLTFEFVLSNYNKPWYWDHISETLKITIEDVLSTSSFALPNSVNGNFSILNISSDDKTNSKKQNFSIVNNEIPKTVSQVERGSTHLLPNTHHFKWSFKHLSCNPNITYQNLQQYPTLDWSYKYFSKNPNLTFDIVLNDLRLASDTLYYNFKKLYPDLSTDKLWEKLKEVSNFKNWDFDFLSRNPNIKFADIIKYRYFNWNWRYVSGRDDLDFNFVFDNLNLTWDWYQLSGNKNLTLEILDKNIDLNWDWEMVSVNPKLTFTNPNKYPKIDYYYLSQNPNLTFDVVLNNLDNNWDFDELSSHPNLSFDFVFNHIDIIEWNWYLLSRHKNLSFDIIQDYFNLNYSDHINSVHKWDMKGLSENPNLTIDFIIRNHTENWDWKLISRNDMNISKGKYLKSKLIKQYKKILNNIPIIKDIKEIIFNYLI